MNAKMQPVNWDDLRFFLAVARSGSYKSAARCLSVNATTVGRRVAVLESVLQSKLFVRTPEALLLTHAGATLSKRAESVEAEVLACGREVTGLDAGINGPLRVTATDGFINYVLLPAVEALRLRHPALALDLRTDTRVLDLSRREADVAIRLVRPREPALVACRIGDMQFGLFASGQYLERRGTPRTTSALAAHDFIGSDASLDTTPQVKWLHRSVPELRYVLRASNTTTQVIAASLAQGIALLPVMVARRERALQRVLPRVQCPSRELWSVTHSDLKSSPKVKAFTEFVSELLRTQRD